MTTTNQAFIKAYRHDARESSVGRPYANRAQHAAATAAAPAAQISHASHGTVEEFLGASVAYVSPDTACEPGVFAQISAGRVDFGARSTRGGVGPAVDSFPIAEPRAGEVVTVARADRPTAGLKRPLSSFTNRSNRTNLDNRKPRADVAPPSTLELRPGTIVASFQWPEICRQLLRRHGKLYDCAADALREQTRRGQSVFGVIGLFREAGASTTALCLSTRLAAGPERVVLVDGHFQAPRLGEYLGAQPTAWWQDVLEHGAPLADALIRSEDDRFDLLPLYPELHHEVTRAPLANGLPFSATAGALRHAYDLALVDLGTFFDPQSQPAAIRLVSAMRISGVVVVTGPENVDARDLNTLTEHLEELNCELLGLIENRAV